jgi:glycosyltransferase involved in cell wall biosynthesis
MSRRVIYLTRSWPRLSQTFIVNEVLALERLGVELEIFAMEPSGEQVRQPQVDQVRSPVTYLDRSGRLRDHLAVGLRHPVRYLRAALFARRNPDLASGYATATSTECLGHAVTVAARVLRLRRQGTEVAHLHAHFAHDPALIALLVRRLTGVTYSITAHARDLYQIPQRSLRVRAADATRVLTCCEANKHYLDVELATGRDKVTVVHHGVDLQQFAPVRRAPAATVQIVSVGRLVEKKGFPDLLEACAEIAADRSFQLTVYGDGPLRAELERMRHELGLDGLVTFAGECDSARIVAALRRADIFALTPFVTPDGDRDGVPNVVVEALACGLPVVATKVGGVGEAVTHRRNGLLAEPRDVAAIAANLKELVGDPDLRARLGAAARRTVEQGFDVDRAAHQLVRVFGLERAA